MSPWESGGLCQGTSASLAENFTKVPSLQTLARILSESRAASSRLGHTCRRKRRCAPGWSGLGERDREQDGLTETIDAASHFIRFVERM